jgi:beta-lactamase regulating signal transducer with metallopeptidase domain
MLPDLASIAEHVVQLSLPNESRTKHYALGGLNWDWETILGFSWETILGFSMVTAWLIGVAILLLQAIIASLWFARRLHSIPEVDDQSTIDIVLSACDQLGVRRPRVKCVPGLPTPALFGMWQPTLCLPEDSQGSLNKDQLRMIALHEAMHIRRGDGYLAWLLTLVRAIHWFNPLAWFTIKKVETYRELACDDAVRRFTQPQQRSVYADLLLRFASERSAASLGLLGLWFARPAKGLSVRIEAFTAKDNSTRRLPGQLSGALLLLLAVAGLTDAASTRVIENISDPELPIFSISDAASWKLLEAHTRDDQKSSETDQLEEREYDLTAALNRIDNVPTGTDPKKWLLLNLKIPGVPSLKPATVKTNNENPNRVTVSMPRSGHVFFANALDEICRRGHVEQITVETRILSSKHVEQIVAADWQGVVKFSAPEPVSSSEWAEGVLPTDAEGLSLSMETVSFEYAPYTALILDQHKMAKLIRYFQSNEQTSLLQAPKVTVFSGQTATLTSESKTPFVTGVHYIKGEFATAAQPNFTVLPEGMKMDLQTRVLDDETVALRCQLVLSSIDGVSQATLPGSEVTVQTPKATRRTLRVGCSLKLGETLLIAPVAGARNDNQKTYYFAISAHEISQTAETKREGKAQRSYPPKTSADSATNSAAKSLASPSLSEK